MPSPTSPAVAALWKRIGKGEVSDIYAEFKKLAAQKGHPDWECPAAKELLKGSVKGEIITDP